MENDNSKMKLEENKVESEEIPSSTQLYQKMKDLAQNSSLPTSTICKKLKLDEKKVQNIYLVGSRLWGTATQKSDFDFLIICKDMKQGKSSLHQGEIDATVYDEKEFIQNVNEHSFLELVCLWLPNEFISKEQIDLKKDFKLDAKKLKASVFEETDRDWRMAEKYFEKGNSERGKKTIVHALRLLLLSIQLINNQKIENLYEAYIYSHQLSSVYETSWKFFDKQYTPVFKNLRNKLDETAKK